ncbi:hypothetical protein [Dyella sp. ASV21]|uniref:hypothetical protein n=1 Tax=Dyella sp. ASV21 TaxID=2795114 RepID=UPI0018ED13FC|nr:hypothetical protein [Dyella sp. ASV21]
MPMSSQAARTGHAILRAVLIVLSIVVLAVCVLMWWVTQFEAAQPMASRDGATPSVQAEAASTP